MKTTSVLHGDYADRTWAKNPNTDAWRSALAKEMRAQGRVPAKPRVLISREHPDYLRPIMFKRGA